MELFERQKLKFAEAFNRKLKFYVYGDPVKSWFGVYTKKVAGQVLIYCGFNFGKASLITRYGNRIADRQLLLQSKYPRYRLYEAIQYFGYKANPLEEFCFTLTNSKADQCFNMKKSKVVEGSVRYMRGLRTQIQLQYKRKNKGMWYALLFRNNRGALQAALALSTEEYNNCLVIVASQKYHKASRVYRCLAASTDDQLEAFIKQDTVSKNAYLLSKKEYIKDTDLEIMSEVLWRNKKEQKHG